MNDTSARDSAATSANGGSTTMTHDTMPGEALDWGELGLEAAIPAAPAAPAGTGNVDRELLRRVGEFESAFGSKGARSRPGKSEGAIANIGKTALMRAAGAGDAESVQRLIDAGANVNATDMSGRTALMWAALGGHAGAVRLLLYAGADAQASHKNGVTALMLARARGHAGVVNILRAATGEDVGDDEPIQVLPDDTAVFSSRRRAWQFAAASALLFAAAAALMHSMGWFVTRTAPAAPAPAPAAVKGVDDILRGVDINARDASGQTALMRAAASGDTGAVRRLIAVGAKLDAVDRQGNTALTLARAAGHKDIVKMLRSAGARRTPPKPAAAKTPPPGSQPAQAQQKQP